MWAHPKSIQVRLGHSSITETMDTYGHLYPEAEHDARGAIDAAFNGPTTAQGLEALPTLGKTAGQSGYDGRVGL